MSVSSLPQDGFFSWTTVSVIWLLSTVDLDIHHVWFRHAWATVQAYSWGAGIIPRYLDGSVAPSFPDWNVILTWTSSQTTRRNWTLLPLFLPTHPIGCFLSLLSKALLLLEFNTYVLFIFVVYLLSKFGSLLFIALAQPLEQSWTYSRCLVNCCWLKVQGTWWWWSPLAGRIWSPAPTQPGHPVTSIVRNLIWQHFQMTDLPCDSLYKVSVPLASYSPLCANPLWVLSHCHYPISLDCFPFGWPACSFLKANSLYQAQRTGLGKGTIFTRLAVFSRPFAYRGFLLLGGETSLWMRHAVKRTDSALNAGLPPC